MARIGFCGGTYAPSAQSADMERAINLFPEIMEAQGAKSSLTMRDRPGTKAFAKLGATAILGTFSCQPSGSLIDRVFAIVQSGQNQGVNEIFQDGTHAGLANLVSPTSPEVTFAQNQTQLAICSGGQVWVLNLTTNALTGPYSPNGQTISLIDQCDGFAIAVNQNSNGFNVSAIEDFTSWPGTNVGVVSELPDNILSIKAMQKTVWFQGRKGIIPYYDFGYQFNPFAPVQGVLIEDGSASVFGRAVVDNTLMWWDQNERGQGIARRMNGYTPQRISNHGIEHMVAQYPKISDAVSWAEEWEGHSFFVTYFPSGIGADGQAGAGAVLVYDVSTGMWHERAFSNAKGYLEAAHMQNHCFAWGKHLVGDWASGTIYEMEMPQLTKGAWSFADDDGVSIQRQRIGPHVSVENEFIWPSDFILDVETGLGPIPPLTGPYAGPGIQNSIIIPDQLGNPYKLTVADDGSIDVAASAGSIQSVILEDSVTPQTAWQITFDSVNHLLAPIAAAWNLGYSQSYPLASAANRLKTALFVSQGLVQATKPYAAPRGPLVTLQFSKDGGRTWINAGSRDAGQAGQYRRRVYWNRVGGRTRVWTAKISYSDAAPLRIVDAYLEGLPDMRPQRRTIQSFQQNA